MQISAIALQGLERAQTQFDRSASRLASPPADTVDLSAEAVSLIAARNSFETNIKVLEVADKMRGAALNLLG
jgi:flagellar hook protein FlgE